MTIQALPRIDSTKRVFIDYSLIEPGYGVSWGDALQASWEMPYGIAIAAHKPRIDAEPMVGPEEPWETAFTLHTTLLEDEGVFRLYYTVYGGQRETSYEEPTSYMLLYAESSDGQTWNKPRIGTVDLEGSKDNNLVYALNVSMNRPVPTATVFKDPSGTPDERYKLIHRGVQPDGDYCVYGATSPDGLHWTPIIEPVIPNYFSDTQIVARYSEEKGKYVGYFRGWTAHVRGRIHGRRFIAYAETDDFKRWPKPRRIFSTDMHDNPGADIYTNAYSPWPGADAHLMFPAFFERQKDITEVRMLTSRDGMNWVAPSREPIVPVGDPGTSGAPALDWQSGAYAGPSVVSLRPDEFSIPITPSSRTHNNKTNSPENLYQEAYPSVTGGYVGYICRASWRKDGFTSLEAETEGAFTTVPFTFEGGNLKINAWTRFRGEIRVEVIDASEQTNTFAGNITPGRSFEDCDPISGHRLLSHTVTWNGDADISALSGRTVRLRFRMKRARLYAIWFE